MLILFKKSRIIDTVDDIVWLTLVKIEQTKTTRSIPPTFQMHLMQIFFFLVQINNGENSKFYSAIHCLTPKLENMPGVIYQIILSTFDSISKKYKKSESHKLSIKHYVL